MQLLVLRLHLLYILLLMLLISFLPVRLLVGFIDRPICRIAHFSTLSRRFAIPSYQTQHIKHIPLNGIFIGYFQAGVAGAQTAVGQMLCHFITIASGKSANAMHLLQHVHFHGIHKVSITVHAMTKLGALAACLEIALDAMQPTTVRLDNSY